MVLKHSKGVRLTGMPYLYCAVIITESDKLVRDAPEAEAKLEVLLGVSVICPYQFKFLQVPEMKFLFQINKLSYWPPLTEFGLKIWVRRYLPFFDRAAEHIVLFSTILV